MDALKKAETDKQVQDQPEVNPISADHEPAASLSLELSSSIDEFDDLPESDVVDEPMIHAQEEQRASIELEKIEPELQQYEKPPVVAVSKVKNTRNKQRIYIIAATLSLVTAIVAGYYFWKFNSINDSTVNIQPANAYPDNGLVETPAVKTATSSQTVSTNQIKRATPIAEESFLEPDPEPVEVKTPIKIKINSTKKQTNQVLLQAYQAYTNSDYTKAKIFYKKVLQRLPRNRDAMLGLAAISLKEGNTNGAKIYYQKILLLNPMDPAARTAMLDLNGVENAARDASQIKHLLQTNNKDAALQFVLGNRYAQAEQWGKAQQAYFQAYEINPGNADYAFNLAISLEQLNKPELAIQYYRIAQQNAANHKANFNPDTVIQRLKILEVSQGGASS
jgi:tetratricopeptide (TPR) repeat protein